VFRLREKAKANIDDDDGPRANAVLIRGRLYLFIVLLLYALPMYNIVTRMYYFNGRHDLNFDVYNEPSPIASS